MPPKGLFASLLQISWSPIRYAGYSLQRLLPSHCCLCSGVIKDTDLPNLCTGCLYDLPFMARQPRCQSCGLGLASSGDHCGQCLHQPPNFSRSYIPFLYQYPVDRLIQGFKYRRQLANGELLSKLLADYLSYCADENPEWQAPDLIIPTPMHWMRRWKRGFNQADIVARSLSRQLEIPLADRLITRRNRTPSQQGLNREQRQRNLRNAFTITTPALVAGKRIALVDDVVTTTATMRELSRLLRKAGAADVQVWALARTPHH
jgi:ComF family protein